MLSDELLALDKSYFSLFFNEGEEVSEETAVEIVARWAYDVGPIQKAKDYFPIGFYVTVLEFMVQKMYWPDYRE